MKSDIYIEHVSPEDLNEVMEVENVCFGPEAFSRSQILYLANDSKGIFLVAKKEKLVIGYISFLTSNRYNTGRIYSIAVIPECRGNGIGEMLLDKGIEFAHQTNLGAVFLEVKTDNSRAISLYEKKGFEKRSVKQHYYKDGSDAYSMVLRLSLSIFM